ncbi:hypothetical protein [Pseudomonas avellanae]|uniref:hypothetical protein n=1 Tax=Pseudomonas avellanae TaxID=46257 RepID=UPI00167757B4|nr:hypothetical protein [Pseudomonas avellanae]UQW68090.1 hypothetical protein L2Y00_23045 [Pseudomonas avellanae]GGJ53937.1 hypothetical protein GCM10009085_54070 [Pseudomonas avellanae]
MITKIKIQGYRIYGDFTLLPNKDLNIRIRPAKSPTQPRKAQTWCALKFRWTPVLAF